jgi:hypothetical protein
VPRRHVGDGDLLRSGLGARCRGERSELGRGEEVVVSGDLGAEGE